MAVLADSGTLVLGHEKLSKGYCAVGVMYGTKFGTRFILQ